MSDHDDLAERREREADALERDNEKLQENTESARDKLEQAQGDELVPAAMGSDDPAHGTHPDEDPEEPTDSDEPEADYPTKG